MRFCSSTKVSCAASAPPRISAFTCAIAAVDFCADHVVVVDVVEASLIVAPAAPVAAFTSFIALTKLVLEVVVRADRLPILVTRPLISAANWANIADILAVSVMGLSSQE
jgi:hypothetical protein